MATAADIITPRNPGDPLAFDRIVSIDVFRGLTMILMIFVNDLSSVHGLPRWTYHAHAMEDRMTYVDMVFPAFLFILGMALPLATERRLRRDPSFPRLWMHIIVRTIALLVFGLILANAEDGSPAHMHGLPQFLWPLLALLGAALFWLVYPRDRARRPVFAVLRFGGLALLIVMAALFRRVTRQGDVAWISTSYPEILGLLAFTYLSVTFLYLLTRRWAWAPLGWFVLLMALCCANAAKLVLFPDHLSLWVWPFSNGSMAAIAMAGLFTSSLFFGQLADSLGSARNRIRAGILFGALCLAAGWMLKPLGISKIRATPTWSLWSIGASVIVFVALFWICDLRRQTRWAFFTRSAGSNTLLTYLLPDFVYFLVAFSGWTWLSHHFTEGWPGIARALLFTGLMLVLSAAFTRARVRLQL